MTQLQNTHLNIKYEASPYEPYFARPIPINIHLFSFIYYFSAMEDYITKDLIDAESNMGAKSDILRQV